MLLPLRSGPRALFSLFMRVNLFCSLRLVLLVIYFNPDRGVGGGTFD